MDDQPSFLEKPAVRASIRFALMLVAYFILTAFLLWDESNLNAAGSTDLLRQTQERRLLAETVDFAFLFGGIVFWLIFFSQFILPVRTLEQRLAIIDRMMSYFSGGHGPAIFIENGNVRARQEERQKRGPGVLWLDSASAAILRTATKFTRTIGPGIHFTTKDEYIAASVDLHPLTQGVGPNDNENPFIVEKTDPDYQAIQSRAWETRGMTRDGINVVAALSVTFRIDAAPNEGGSRYGYHAENTRRAITEAIVQGAQTDQPVWNPLPAKMAVDVWREYLARFRLSQLFEIPEGKEKTNLQIIGELVSRRMREDEVDSLDDVGNFTGLAVHSLEAQKMREMGIKVSGVNIKRLIFPKEIEDQLVSSWTTSWEKNAKKERELIDSKRRQAEEKGQVDALLEFANVSTAEFQQTLPRNKVHMLYMFVHGTAQAVIRNAGLIKKMPKTDTALLTEIARWLKDKV
jgi:regulator of protease activity HflC (stomatin/prohibitin superfamily)